MSWFEYGTPKKPHSRRGVFLRVRRLPQDILDRAKQVMLPDETIEMVKVLQVKPLENQVLLKFYCREALKDEPRLTAHMQAGRHIVFTLVADINPEWICEGDLGRGWVE